MSGRLKLSLWKPRKSGDGSAALFDFNDLKGYAFLTMMPQNGEKSFNAEKKINVKLGANDIGEIIACLRGRTGGVGQLETGPKGSAYKGLYHKSGKGDDSSVIGFGEYIKEDKLMGYNLSLSVKRNGEVSRQSVSVTFGEAEQLNAFCQAILPKMLYEENESQVATGADAGQPA